MFNTLRRSAHKYLDMLEHMMLEIACCIQAETDEEMPERLLCSVSVNFSNMRKARKLPEDLYCLVECVAEEEEEDSVTVAKIRTSSSRLPSSSSSSNNQKTKKENGGYNKGFLRFLSR